MFPSPTADPMAERMKTFREPKASRVVDCVVADGMGRGYRRRCLRVGELTEA
jgi:uncharacterized protein CbrC (UPF0167 family)